MRIFTHFCCTYGKGMQRKIVIASDSFKGSLTSMQVASSVELGIRDVMPECNVIKVDIADGGEGTMEAILRSSGGRIIRILVSGPLGEPVEASYAILDDGLTAVIEMAAASGLTLIPPSERNPMLTSTYGTGELIADALDRGCRRFLVGIGGSATNDAGMGMLTALGFRFLDSRGQQLPPVGGSLGKVAYVDRAGMHAGLADAEFLVACDVDAPFHGPRGAAFVFAPQKGAGPDMVRDLDRGLENMAEVILRLTGKDIAELPGAGAAGGLGGGFVAFLNARLERGVEMLLDAVGFDSLIEGASLVITGEGRIDSQTLAGKTPFGVMMRARRKGIPVIAIGGSVAPDAENLPGFDSICCVTPPGMPTEAAMDPMTASANIRRAVGRLLKSL